MSKFYANDFKFNIVKMNVFNVPNPRNKNLINMTYYLLVDEVTNFIYDYRIHVNDIYLSYETTKSHEISKKNSWALKLRLDILKKLNIEHFFRETNSFRKKAQVIQLNSQQIEILNKNLDSWAEHLKLITFQNIEYIIAGSNPSGQGNGKGLLQVEYQKQNYCFGFLLQALNKCKSILDKNGNLKQEYKSIFDLDWNELPQIEFEDWIKSDIELAKAFKDFKNFSHDWKNHIDILKNILKKRKKENTEINKLILNKRNDFVKNINLTFKNVDLLKTFYGFEDNHELNLILEKAHIKPVHLSKKQYLNSVSEESKTKILLEISDINNYLPLPSDIHTYYDRFCFYWDVDGSIITSEKINNLNKTKYEIYKIQKDMLTVERINYINQYKEWYRNQKR